jgi:hypothetical protein
MKKQFLIILALFLTLFSACETRETGNIKDVTQSEIYQDLSFTSDGSTTNVRATLSFAGVRGTTLKLTNPSKILFNEQPLDEQIGQYSGTYYEKNFDSVLSNGTFTFTDTKGKTYTNKVELPAIDFKTLPTAISRSAINRLPIINGNKIAASDVKIEVEYENKQGFQTKSLQVFPNKQDADSAYFDEKTQSIIIEPNIWQDVKAAKVKIKITSKSAVNLQQGTAIGGKINAEFNGKTINANLIGKVITTVKSNLNTKTQSANANSMVNTGNVVTNANVKKPLANSK